MSGRCGLTTGEDDGTQASHRDEDGMDPRAHDALCLARCPMRIPGTRYDAAMEPVARLIPAALASLLRKAPLSDGKVAFAWRSAVGPAMDKVTTVTLDGTVLRVRARDEVWKRGIERSTPLIQSRIAEVLGDEVVRRIDVQVG